MIAVSVSVVVVVVSVVGECSIMLTFWVVGLETVVVVVVGSIGFVFCS
jgi:hypothetical protein